MATISYDNYTFSVEEMHAVLNKQREDSERIGRLGPAAFDDASLEELINFDMGRTLAIVDYYHLVYVPSESAKRRAGDADAGDADAARAVCALAPPVHEE